MLSLDSIHLESDHLIDPYENSISSIDFLTDIDYGRLRFLCSLFHCRVCQPNAVDRIHNSYVGISPQTPCCIHFALKKEWPKQLPMTLLPLIGGFLLDTVDESFLTSVLDPSYGVCQCKIIKTSGRWDLMLEIKDNSQFDSITQLLNSSTFLGDEENERKKMVSRIYSNQIIANQDFDEKKNINTTSSGASSTVSTSNVLIDTHLDDHMNQILIRDSTLVSCKHVLNQKQDLFLASGYQEFESSSTSYFVTRERPQAQDEEKHSKTKLNQNMVIGKVKSNRSKTSFTLFDFGTTLKSITQKKALTHNTKRTLRECGVVEISDFFNSDGSPAKIKVLLPHRQFSSLLSTRSSICSWSWIKSRVYDLLFSTYSEGKILKQFQAEQRQSDLEKRETKVDSIADTKEDSYEFAVRSNMKSMNPVSVANAASFLSPGDFYSHAESPNQQVEVFENLRPVWHERMSAWVLSFDNSRVKSKCHKNFKLVRVNDEQKKTILQFGKGEKDDEFVMDFQHPLSPLAAFLICIGVINEHVC